MRSNRVVLATLGVGLAVTPFLLYHYLDRYGLAWGLTGTLLCTLVMYGLVALMLSSESPAPSSSHSEPGEVPAQLDEQTWPGAASSIIAFGESLIPEELGLVSSWVSTHMPPIQSNVPTADYVSGKLTRTWSDRLGQVRDHLEPLHDTSQPQWSATHQWRLVLYGPNYQELTASFLPTSCLDFESQLRAPYTELQQLIFATRADPEFATFAHALGPNWTGSARDLILAARDTGCSSILPRRRPYLPPLRLPST